MPANSRWDLIRRLRVHFSERIPVVKWRMTLYVEIWRRICQNKKTHHKNISINIIVSDILKSKIITRQIFLSSCTVIRSTVFVTLFYWPDQSTFYVFRCASMYVDTQVVSFQAFFLSLFQSRNLVSCFTNAVYHRQSIQKRALAQMTDICWHSRIILVCSCEVSRTNFSRWSTSLWETFCHT